LKRLRFHEDAEREFLEELVYLERQAAGLGKRLLQAVKDAEILLRSHPESGPEVLSGIRKLVLRNFSFSMIYSIEEDELVILAFAPHRRRPRYWLDRLG